MELCTRGVERLGESVSVGGEELTVAMAKAARDRIGVAIEPKSVSDQNADLSLFNMAITAGLPFDWAAEKLLHEESPATLRIMKKIEEVEATPELQQLLVQDIIEDFMSAVEQDELEEVNPEDPSIPAGLQEAASGPGPGGMTGMGNGPFPEGAATQTLQGGRGLTTPKEQPEPGAAGAGTGVMQ
jgi:hypothetical protein